MTRFPPSPLERAKAAYEASRQPEPDPADGCLCCGRVVCDCDQRYDDWRDSHEGQ